MNASRFVCDFKGINAQTLEDKVLESVQRLLSKSTHLHKN